ncbi:hypothetical protein ARTSIC4J27_1334 [Pseudarthrobacter siccitolerans]|uniref:Uncharacterized protein n=1 Tax=Pseudarthrobacter siccitolerans TaxID=861266 RepID=A0A024H063_9MICC|nr:hypothetical protein ARTSIC4J27_1334 [Pseudarthrobacter siccitolerans]
MRVGVAADDQPVITGLACAGSCADHRAKRRSGGQKVLSKY